MSIDEVSILQFGDSPNGIEHLEILAHGGGFTAAVSFEAPDEVRRNILAAVLSQQLGLRSVDYTRKTYVDPYYDERPQRTTSLTDAIAITADAKWLVYGAAQRGYAIRNKPDHVGLFAAGAALLRLPVTFRAATLTIRNAFTSRAPY